ncbi:type II toxin-antitoxin system PemK/MazF family toxin [Sphaerospermopsis torques-reginae]|nr:type II toxin-antitoxin system PemK/MazF family toxin [Sphaerospermopsis torques-reginae]
MLVNIFDIFLVNLNPTIGSEIQKTYPCLIISPKEMQYSSVKEKEGSG